MNSDYTIETSMVFQVETGKLPEQLQIARTQSDLLRIENFREALFRPLYPELDDSHNDQYDKHSLILFTENGQGEIISTARMIFDSEDGFPSDDYAKEYIDQRRKAGLNLLEVSRFAISDEARKLGLLPVYYRAFYELSLENDIDSMIIAINSKGVGFHKSRVGAELLIDSINNIAGSNFQFSCMEWKLAETKDKFLKWVGCLPKKSCSPERYEMSEWNSYSRCFASVMTHVQRELYHDAAQYLTGHVVDLGAGAARLAPLLVDNRQVSHYTAVEYADDMVQIARFTLAKLDCPTFEVLHQKVEEVQGIFTSAVALQSFYAWDKPVETLRHIYDSLVSDGIFVLATPNNMLDQKKLFHEAEKELMWHPDFEIFRQHNLQIEHNPSANFIAMDVLIKQVQEAGFEVCNAHTKHYGGGVNFVVMKKS